MEKRITRSFEQINKLNESNKVAISLDYLRLKLSELFLAHEYREKLKAEREDRAESLRLVREEQRLLRDFEKAQEDEERYAQLLKKAKDEASQIVGPQLDAFSDQIKKLEKDLEAARKKLERALHSEFEAARVNAQNFRKEFFRVTLDEIEAALQRLAPDAPFFKDIEAQEYHETLSRRRVALEAKLETQGFPASL